MSKLLSAIVLIGALVGCNNKIEHGGSQPAEYNVEVRKPVKAPKNIIFMVGDGMGISQITAGLYRNGNKLNLEKFPVVGIHKSYSADNLITDSAAGATAFSCGIKTYNGAIGVDEKKKPVPTILEQAEERGLATGLVATSTIVHATPASYISHVKSRKMYEEIAEDFLDTEVDLFIGGGKKYFDAREKDNRNISNELMKKGYLVSDYTKGTINEIATGAQNLAYFTAEDDPAKVSDGRDYLVPASQFSPVFLDKRDGGKGFFLMIEGSQIDWGGHANDSEYIISEMIDFDNAIGEVLKFAEQDGETLVVVTADHETGGYAINPGSTQDTIVAGFTTGYHTAALIPVFAYGPGAELFSGIYENTAIYHKMIAAYGWQMK